MREPPTAEDVAELRARLYRPDPPAGAVDAYLDALERMPGEPQVVVAAAAPHDLRRARIGVAVVGCLAAASIVTGAIVSESGAAPFAVPTAAVRLVATAPVDRYPPATGDELGVLSGTGLGVGRFDAGGRTVVVSVYCSGDGTLSLQIDVDTPVVLACRSGSAPALAMIPSIGPEDVFTVWVARSGPVRWSATVGAIDLGAG